MKKNIMIAFGSVPKDGGTFTFYRTVRPGLLEHGIDIRCVTVGKEEADLVEPSFMDDGCVLLAENIFNVKQQAMIFADWCEKNGVDMVFAINSVAILSVLPHLPEKIRVMSRCANAFDHGYKITVSSYQRLMRIVTTAPKHGRDLVENYGVSEDRIYMIPNGIEVEKFKGAALRNRGKDTVLRLGFLGRLEHNQKGVLFLPDILRRLDAQGIAFSCKIAGKGVHERALRQELKSFIQNGNVEFVGPLSPDLVPQFLGSVDVYLFPSLFEGCPNALLEAMMAGCVPVAWTIEGVTDYIIDNGRTGFVCPLGDCEIFAEKIAALAKDRNRLQKMSVAAAEDARKRFSQGRLVADYAELIHSVMEEPVRPWTPVPWPEFILNPEFRRSFWRKIIPPAFKRVIKNSLFHMGMSRRYIEP